MSEEHEAPRDEVFSTSNVHPSSDQDELVDTMELCVIWEDVSWVQIAETTCG